MIQLIFSCCIFTETNGQWTVRVVEEDGSASIGQEETGSCDR